ncbi:low temperature requirement protein LtrA [Hamadaea flava]|uniref:Low temperature requirement protein A n=1 Tax=Hamadaea flava TaxID=1742688 RepID=A0ABV8LL22_9ACTN|nr:low temperature requirement protein A [Hamadaea flava]MCP2324837.1 low temperature requirement protein LtrA [Hamadaea flava]
MTAPEVPAGRESVVRVSTLELFFDLVFVFTITQLTAVLAHDLTVGTTLQVLLLLLIIWWMYDGFAWMTNTAAPTDPVRRGLLLLGMAGFLLIALALPDAFGAAGWAFGVGYFLVNAIHSGLLLRVAPAAMRLLAPLNLVSASLVLVGGFVPDPWRAVLWIAAALVMTASPYLHRLTEWNISSAHFVERHGLIVIIALGESIVAIGVGAGGLELTATLIFVAFLGLVLSFLLWWVYFGGDDSAAEEALDRTPVARRGRAALHAFGWAHVPLLLGVIGLAAGVKKAIGHATDHISVAQALVLSGGVAVFLLGDALFRRILRIGTPWFRFFAGIGALLTVPLGLWLNAVAQLAALVVVVAALLLAERRAAQSR